ncbi:MAG TPA: hypothetical protein VNL77_00930, partial [Roseiflexaceae bacterium]|nr:hypothetical protein [Roseiflexaceae bacterium]
DKEGRDLLKKLDEFERELGKEKPEKAGDKLRDMAQRTIELVREGKMDAGFGQQVLNSIAAVADALGLQVILEDGGRGNGRGRGKDD